MDEGKRTNEPGYLLGGLIIAVLLGFQVWPLASGGADHRVRAVVVGIYLQLWLLLFLAAYFFRHKSFFFRGLMWVCERFSHPSGEGMALAYFGLAFVLGTISVLQGLGY